MAPFDTVREVRIALTVEDLEQAVQFYRDRLGLAVVEEWQRPEGRGVILALGPQTTLELFDAGQADFVDQVEVGRRVSGPVRLALAVPDAQAAAEAFQQAGAQLLSHARPMPWGDRNARIQTPDGMQVTLYQAASAAHEGRAMTAQPTIGLISPGDMGHALGAVLVQHGLHVLTNLQGRSARTVALAMQAGMTDVGDDETLVREADLLLSVLVPAQALALAERLAAAVRATRSELLFADCNAVSPRTAKAIERLLSEAGAEVVDVGIIGAPPRAGRAETRLYASGLGAARLAILGEYGLDVRVIGTQVGQASGLKMCYASLTKGLTALATQALTAGEALGLFETLTSELRESQAELFAWFERQVPRMPPKAYRWVGEMEEIARTFADLGLPPQMLEGAAALYRLVERTELGAETPEERHQGQTLAEVVGILADASNGNWR
jgi:3-hydroxyisobutyrate dehydrogenase-like beta-hydroxyacid dehydrogenase/catechol 2,3-dioxygenase-like lactoylglutathione lyase family enzyme